MNPIFSHLQVHAVYVYSILGKITLFTIITIMNTSALYVASSSTQHPALRYLNKNINLLQKFYSIELFPFSSILIAINATML